MDGFKRMITFGIGGAIGTLVGAAVASLMAPQSGKELQASAHGLVNEAKAAGDLAQAETEARLRERFRETTGKRGALADVVELPAGDSSPRLPSSI